MILPYGNMDQLFYRIVRKDSYGDDIAYKPLWLDFIDKWSVFQELGWFRLNFYNRCQCHVENEAFLK